MSASWAGRVALAEADALPGHYYVTVRREDGAYFLALGPFTQYRPGKDAHARALGLVRRVRRHVNEIGANQFNDLLFGTARRPITDPLIPGKLNKELMP